MIVYQLHLVCKYVGGNWGKHLWKTTQNQTHAGLLVHHLEMRAKTRPHTFSPKVFGEMLTLLEADKRTPTEALVDRMRQKNPGGIP